ncbi:response regulator, partial [Singulisphaera rosea]
MRIGDPVRILIARNSTKGQLAFEVDLDAPNVTLIHASAEEAFDRAQEDGFASILLDARTLDRSGLELARRIRESGRQTPILFVDTSDDFPVQEAYALAAVDHMSMPGLPIVLRAKVATAVELYRRTQESVAAELMLAQVVARNQDELWLTTLSSIGDAVIATDQRGRVSFL